MLVVDEFADTGAYRDRDHDHSQHSPHNLRKYNPPLHVHLLHGLGYPFVRGCAVYCLQKESQQHATHPTLSCIALTAPHREWDTTGTNTSTQACHSADLDG